MREPDWNPGCDTPGEFIAKLMAGEELQLVHDFTWEDHFRPQSHWITPYDYEKSIIVRYRPNLEPAIRELIRYLGLQEVSATLGSENRTNKRAMWEFSPGERAWLLDLLASDFLLWELLGSHPEYFRHVI